MMTNSEINRLPLVRQRAHSLYKKYNLTVPVDLETIIQKKNITVIFEENQVGIDGMCQLQKDPPTIILNSEITYKRRRRFTLAHELGHICIPWHAGVDLCSLDDPYYRSQGQKMVNTQELEANVFASELLMPTEWLKNNFELTTENLSQLVQEICDTAETSIMACFYALENVLPAGELFFVKLDHADLWKPFYGVSTECSYISASNAIRFYDSVCCWKKEFQLHRYQVIHYRILPSPDFLILNDLYTTCNSNIEELLYAITGGHPIYAIPYIKEIVEALDDRFYVIIKIGNICVHHVLHPYTAIRMYTDQFEDVDQLYEYIQGEFYSYGRMDFSATSCLLWVKECWRGDVLATVRHDPHDLLKEIVGELYAPGEDKYMLQSINGVMASINSRHPDASREELCHYANLRFQTDPKYDAFVNHHNYDQYIAGKTTSLLARRRRKK